MEHKDFWNKEYKTSEHLALSIEPSEDLEKFTRFLERESKRQYLNTQARVLDIGCGNGRNLIYLAQTYGMRGYGIDISNVAIEKAEPLSEGLPIEYQVGSMADPLPLPDGTQTLVLDMMSSHFLKKWCACCARAAGSSSNHSSPTKTSTLRDCSKSILPTKRGHTSTRYSAYMNTCGPKRKPANSSNRTSRSTNSRSLTNTSIEGK